MKLRYIAALTLLCSCFQLGQANALGWKQCHSQAQCGPKEFCGVVQNQPVGTCQPSDSWPLTPATTTDASTGVYGSSVVSGGCCGADLPNPPGSTPPDSPPPDWAHLEREFDGACVTITKVSSGATVTNQVVASAVCNKLGNYRIALPPGDYLLKSIKTNKSETVRVKIGVFQLIDLSVFLHAA
jgi:hypothetical protein